MARPTKSGIRNIDEQYFSDDPQPSPGFDPGTVGDDLDMTSDLQLQATLSQLGDNATDARVMIYQIDDKTKRESYLYTTTVMEFSANGLDEIRDRYGSGDYHIRVFGNGGILTRRKVSIGGALKPQSSQTQNTPGGIENIIAAQNAMFMSGLEKIAGMIASQHAPAPQGMGVQETIGLISALSPLMQGGRQQRETDPLEMLTRMLEIQKSIAPLPTNGSGEVDSGVVMLEALKTLGPVISSAMTRTQPQQQQQQQQQPQLQQQPQPRVALPPPAIQNPIQPEQNDMSEISDMQLAINASRPIILTAAAGNMPVQTYADMMLDFLSDEDIDTHLRPENWFENLLSMLPEAAEFRPWFSALRDEILSALTAEATTATIQQIQQPDAGNVTKSTTD